MLVVTPSAIDWAEGMPQIRFPIEPNGSGVRLSPPNLDQHSVDILQELGYDTSSIARLTKH